MIMHSWRIIIHAGSPVPHLLNLKDHPPAFLEAVLSTAARIKAAPSRFGAALAGKKLYLLFQKTSTRTALSFAAGAQELGAFHFSQRWEESNFAVGEPEDEIRYVARNVDLVVARLRRHEDLARMAAACPVPLVNGCCDRHHPCQALADLLTLRERFGSLEVKVLYLGVRNNVLNSLVESLPRLGGELLALTPVVNGPAADEELYRAARATGRFRELDPATSRAELREVVASVDAVYTDTWVDMESFHDPAFRAEKEARIRALAPLQVDEALLAGTRAVVLHDMPIHAGLEISRPAAEAHMATILQQAENRRHAQKGLLVELLRAA
jgi:ornithine carbamoyltransferase